MLDPSRNTPEEAPPPANLEEQRNRLGELVARHRQGHVFSSWESLDNHQKEQLLRQIGQIDFELLGRLYSRLVLEKKPAIEKPPKGLWQPAQPVLEDSESAKEAGLKVLKETHRALYGLLVVAGGSGSGLKFEHPKGLFPATPLSGTPLFEAIVKKSKAAAKMYGHARMFPIVVMVSDETAQETRAYFEAHGYFGERDRIYFAHQTTLPLLDRRPGLEGRVVMKAPDAIYVGGAGHGDAFDHTLSVDQGTLAWLRQLGVRYLQFMNVDNLLNPVGDPYFLGEHVLSEEPRVAGRAHISAILIPKNPAGRMGNIIEVKQHGQTLQESIDYGLVPEVDQRCQLGHASLQIVTLESLDKSEPIPFTVSQKEIKIGEGWIPVWKFERSSNNKRRFGALSFRESEDVFAPIKKRDEEAVHETPGSAKELQSRHWKKLITKAAGALGRGWAIPESSIIELPWEAEYMTPQALIDALDAIAFPTTLAPMRGYLVLPDFGGFTEITVEDSVERAGLDGKSARRREEQSAEAHRMRGIIAQFNNIFEADPDLIVRAPGRNTLIGDHQDYPPLLQDGSAHSFTIAWASNKNVLVAARRRHDHAIKLFSVNHRQTFSISLDDLQGLSEEAAHENLPDIYGQELYPWAMNVLALLYSARHGRDGVRTGLPIEGAEFVIEGNVPIGAGQSSSAAFLVAMTLACNDLFHWGIPRSDLLTLADLARSGEHEDYSPFIAKGRCGYLDQITSLAAVEGQAVLIDHGNYHRVKPIDLSFLEEAGYTVAVVLSDLSRSLAETDYATRVEELDRLPKLMNRLLFRHDRTFSPRNHVHQFSFDEWRGIAPDLEREDPTLARRARYVFEENKRTLDFIEAMKGKDISRILQIINLSGEGMSMAGPFQISGLNKVPRFSEPFPALDALRNIVLHHAGPAGAVRMIGGGGAGPLCLLIKTEVLRNTDFAGNVAQAWRTKAGLSAKVEVDPPSRGAHIVWRRPASRILKSQGPRRIEQYLDAFDEPVFRLVNDESGYVVEVLAFRGTVRSISCIINGIRKAILYNPEEDPAENGSAPYLGPWINRIKDGRAIFRGRSVNLMQVKGVRDDGHGHALHGLMTVGWKVDINSSGLDPDGGVRLVSAIETKDYTDHAGVQAMFGPSKTVLTHRLFGKTLFIESEVIHLGADANARRVPVQAAVHPWFLLHPKKHEFVELTIPARRRRLLWKKSRPRLHTIPVPFLPALPVPSFSRHFFKSGRRLGREPYDDVYTDLEAGMEGPTAVLKDWFRDVLIEVGAAKGYNEFTIYRLGGDANFVCIEPQIGTVNALGSGAPVDASIPTIGPGESFTTSMFIRISSLSSSGSASPFTARHRVPLSASLSKNFPVLLKNGMETGPLAEPQKTTAHKDATRVFFRGNWHIYGTGHEMRDVSNPPPGHRPHRRSIMFHLTSEALSGPYVEENPPVLLGDFPKGVYEAPTVVPEGNRLHLFAQTTYYKLGGTIEHFVSEDGQMFHWVGTALRSTPRSAQAGIYDVDAWQWNASRGFVYSGFSREGGRDDRPDPCVFLATSRNGWEGPFDTARSPILSDRDVPWHNSHDPANPFYEWGLEGAQVLRLPNGRLLLLSVGFEKRPSRDYMAAQRLFFALYDEKMKLLEVSNPILPLVSGWDEYGHGSMMVDPNDPCRLRILFQARPGNLDKNFRDSDTWRLFEAIFDLNLPISG